jgi:protoporphyrinogen oxidase
MAENVLILGAGPAGMAAAFELFKAGKTIQIIEKNSEIGGLARTLKFGEFRTDIGPHRFFSQNQYLYRFIEDLLKERWIRVNRLTRFYINGKFLFYPVEMKNALQNMGPYKGFRILFDYFLEKTKNKIITRKPASFEEHIVSEFGRTLAELNMINYTEKIWGIPCSEISPDWAKQRIKGLSLMSVIKKTIAGSKEGPKSMVDQFYYPDNGSALVYEKMKERMGSEVGLMTESTPCRIAHDSKKIVEVEVQTKDEKVSYKPDHVISSVPITEFVSLFDPSPPKEITEAASQLRFRSHVSLFITVSKPCIFKDQWIYFPERGVPFGRIMEPKNFSKKMSPEDKTSLLVEFFCWENDTIWNADEKELFELSIKWLERLKFIRRNEAIDYFVHREKFAYPVYHLDYKKHLEKLKSYLNFENLKCIGRSGLFKYNNIDHALEMGILAARGLIEGKEYNIEEVGAEQEYFERGHVK